MSLRADHVFYRSEPFGGPAILVIIIIIIIIRLYSI